MIKTKKKQLESSYDGPITEAVVLAKIYRKSAPFDAYRVYDVIEGYYRRTDYLKFRGDPQRCKAVYDILSDLRNRRLLVALSGPRLPKFLDDVPSEVFAVPPNQRKSLAELYSTLREKQR